MYNTFALRYGLILPIKNKNKVGGELGTRKLNPLLDSDDELDQDEEYPLDWVEASLKPGTQVSRVYRSGCCARLWRRTRQCSSMTRRTTACRPPRRAAGKLRTQPPRRV
ncbi:uncharacterized protein LOC126990879 [Eriocheir sinensis]|uniref:uncharacterized protein LOC126990879 n=1 Tax=Eriocheir sinensis TaxID=95602 RepID=UPI0021C77367|nr:uncharacterized protein LOC126990879 [Eriocheir sinensis]